MEALDPEMEAKIEALANEIVEGILMQEAAEVGRAEPSGGGGSRPPSSPSAAGDAWQSESSFAFVEHALPLRGNDVLPGWSIPIALDRAAMSTRNWKSEQNDKLDLAVAFAAQLAKSPEVPVVAGNKSATDAKAPSFFAWSVLAPAGGAWAGAAEDAAAEEETAAAAVPGLIPAPSPSPFGMFEEPDARTWQSEYTSATHAAQAAETPAVTAGVPSQPRDEPPAFFYWPVDDTRAASRRKNPVPLISGTEHADSFSWPIDETSPSLAPAPVRRVGSSAGGAASAGGGGGSAPFGVWAGIFAEDKWASEYSERFVGAAPPAPPAAPAASVPSPSKKATETGERYTWPPLPAVAAAAAAAAATAAALPPPPARKGGRMLTVSRDSYRWPETSANRSGGGRVAKKSNTSDPALLAHPVTVATTTGRTIATINEALAAAAAAATAGGDETTAATAGALSFDIDSLAATAQATAADTMSSGNAAAAAGGGGTAVVAAADAEQQQQQQQRQQDETADADSVPGSSITGPSINRKAVAWAADKSRRAGGGGGGGGGAGVAGGAAAARQLAVVGTKILNATAAASAPSAAPAASATTAAGRGRAGAKAAPRSAAAKIFSKIQARSPANPVLSNKRYPSTSDRQNGRWVTEARAAYALRPLLKAAAAAAAKVAVRRPPATAP